MKNDTIDDAEIVRRMKFWPPSVRRKIIQRVFDDIEQVLEGIKDDLDPWALGDWGEWKDFIEPSLVYSAGDIGRDNENCYQQLVRLVNAARVMPGVGALIHLRQELLKLLDLAVEDRDTWVYELSIAQLGWPSDEDPI